MAPSRFAIFAHPRSGSSNLLKALQLHPELKILEEPFNESFNSWRPDAPCYLKLVNDPASLAQQLERIFSCYNGIKTLDYQLSYELYGRLLQQPDIHIVFLRRKNLLQSVISVLLAHHTNLWKRWEQTKPIEELYRSLPPFSIEEIGERMTDLKERLEHYERVVDARGGGVFKLVYEEFYFATAAHRRAVFDSLVKFLGAHPFDHPKISFYLEPETGRINTPSTYRFIPNADEINVRCGSAATGWLF